MAKNEFYNYTYNSDNRGYCDDNCLGNGVHNISACNFGK